MGWCLGSFVLDVTLLHIISKENAWGTLLICIMFSLETFSLKHYLLGIQKYKCFPFEDLFSFSLF